MLGNSSSSDRASPSPFDSDVAQLYAETALEGQPERAPLALQLAASDDHLPHLTGEIRDLLLTRLKEVALLVTVGWSFVLLLILSGFDGLLNARELGWSTVAVIAAGVAVFAGCRAAMSLRNGYSLFVLRSFEAVYLWGAVACATWLRIAAVHAALSTRPLDRYQVLYASAFSNLVWMAVLVIYGIFAPNTWRRLLTITGILVAIVLATELALWHDMLSLAPGLFLSNLLITTMTLFLGGGVAVYGSFKLSAAHQEAARIRRQLRDLGRYRLVRQLGTGAMGEVYLAEHVLLRRPCAVKIIRPDRADGEKLVARFTREVQATAALTHPNTVEIYDYGRAKDGTFYYAMEYLPGLNLDEMVEKYGPLPPARVVYLLRQVCGALHEAHQAGLIHRDIKPANILVCSRGGVHDIVKLLDFGLVRTVQANPGEGKLTQDGAIAGTPEYMSPEQAQGQLQLDGRSDIYSVGVVAYFLLTGRPPFERPNVLQMLFAHVHDPVPPLGNGNGAVPAELERVVMRCLAKGREERFQAVRDVEGALAGLPEAGEWGVEAAAEWWSRHP